MSSEMTEESFHYLTQDFCWNASDNYFVLNLHTNVFSPHDIEPLLDHIEYRQDGDAEIAIFHNSDKSVVIHCKCKGGIPLQRISVDVESQTRLSVRWPGVTRIFARVRIVGPTDPDTMISMLRDDIDGGYSVSDVDNPEENQSHRPFSDGEDSETDTLGGDGEPPSAGDEGGG